MKKLILIVLALVAVSSLQGQTTSTPPKPGPEHARLAALLGNWTTEGQSAENPFGPVEKWSGKILSEPFDGNFAVVRRLEGTGSASGEVRGLDVIAYDAAAKTYTWYSIDNQGGTGLGKGSISGDTLTVVWDWPVKGRNYKIRGTLKGLGSDKLAWTQEYSEDGKVWKIYFRSTDTRSK